MIKICSCKHTYQDKRYGKNRRVHNPTKDGIRCTVCNNETRANLKRT